MHERQAVVAVVTLLFFAVIFSSESFAQVPQCNGLYATIVGTEDRDKIQGTSGDDVIVGLGGSDIIYGKGGNDVICGGKGNDKLFGNSGNDILLGEKDNNKLNGGQGIDTCDSSSSDKRVISCEVPYIEEDDSDESDDLQKQISDIQNKLNNMILGLFSWTDIQGIPESLADGDDDMLGSIKCDAKQILVFDGNSWICNDVLENIQITSDCNGNLVNFAGLSHGASLNEIQEKLEPFGITLSATGNGKDSMNTVIIYDSNTLTGEDSDLEVGIGNLAIIPDNLENPSDSSKGGKQVYELNPPRTVSSFVVVDFEETQEGYAKAYSEDGSLISSTHIPYTGGGSYGKVKVNAENVAKLEIEYNGSGAITKLCMMEETSDELNLNTDVLGELNCQIDEIVKWDGNEWICSDEDISSSSPIFFHWSTGRGTEWLGTNSMFSNGAAGDRAAIVMPQAGTIGNLYANLGISGDEMFPGIGESFTLTLIKNDVEETSLSCMMTDLMSSCSDSEHLVSVNQGDTIVLRMDATEFSNDAVIRSSILLSIP